MNDKKALIIIDMQNGFIDKEKMHLVSKIRSHIDINKNRYDHIIFFKFINTNNSNLVKRLNWTKFMDRNHPDTFICDKLIEIANSNVVFEKNTYSIFKNEDFKQLLIQNNITNLDICGIDGDACVLASIFEAFDLNYNFNVLTDLIDSSLAEMNECAINIIRRNIGI